LTTVRRRITGFHQDTEGDWVAQLSCLHSQHVRHRPPFQERPWVLDAESRTARIGTELDCPRCDRAELPDDLHLIRTAGPFTDTSLPAALRQRHRVGEGTWGSLRVLQGTAGFELETEPPIARRLVAGDRQAIPPSVPHKLTIEGPVELAIDFLSRD
jgi:tellurite resistance-related uncharacterized protein